MSYEQQLSLLGSDQTIWPPDVQLAVGPTTLIEVVNSNYSIWTRSGTFVTSVDLNALFSVPTGYVFSDPRVAYDSLSGLFILTGMAFDAANDGQVYLAVSASSDPAGLWYTYLVSSNTSRTFYDQPKVGVSSDKIVISWADYSTTSFIGEELWILDKSEAIAGMPPEYAQYTPDTQRFGMVPSLEPTATSVAYVVYNNADKDLNQNEAFPTAGVIAINGTPSQHNVSSNYYVGTLPQIAKTYFPPDAAQPGGGPLIATNDDRFLSAVWQADKLWTGGNDQCKPRGDTQWRSCLRLVQIATGSGGPTVLQSFDVGVAGADLYYPAETVDGSGNLFVTFSWSSATQYASVGTLAQSTGAPSGTVGGILTTQSGLGIANNCGTKCQNTDGSSLNRWGDYSAAAPDPANPVAVWVAGEYAGSATDQLDWGTGFAQLALPLTPIPSPTATPTATSTPVVVQVTPGVATQVSTTVGSDQVSVDIPSGNAIAQIVVSAPPTQVSITPDGQAFQSLPGAVIVVSASDANGHPVGQLSAPITITIQFVPPPGVNAQFAVIYTLDPNNNNSAQALPTRMLANGDGSFTAIATTSHLSPFEVFAPGALTPVPQMYLPVVASQATGG